MGLVVNQFVILFSHLFVCGKYLFFNHLGLN
jgi:hypothetical protein